MIQVQPKLSMQRDRVNQLLTQLIKDEQNAKVERKALAEEYSGTEDGFILLEELELLTVRIQGYASQIESEGTIKHPEQAIADLQSWRVFDVLAIVQFYREARSRYPQTQSYIYLLDYLRLLVLEYLEMQQKSQAVPA